MSFELTQKVIRNQLKLSLCEKMMLAIIADKIDHKGFCYPSYNTLRTIGDCTRRHVIRSIKVLVRHKLITIKKILGKGNQYTIDEKVLDKRIDEVKKGESTGDIESLALVSQSHPPSDIVSPHWCHDVTLVDKVVNKEVDKGSKVISKNKITKSNSGSKEGVGEEMKIEDLDLVKFEKTDKKKMNPIDVWRNACVDYQNEHILAKVNLNYKQVHAGTMNKVAKSLDTMYQPCVESAVSNWGAFVKFVNLETGGSKKPPSPNMNFFVYHSHYALLFAMKKMDKSDTKIKSHLPPFKKKPVTDPYTKALLKAVGKLSGD